MLWIASKYWTGKIDKRYFQPTIPLSSFYLNFMKSTFGSGLGSVTLLGKKYSFGNIDSIVAAKLFLAAFGFTLAFAFVLMSTAYAVALGCETYESICLFTGNWFLHLFQTNSGSENLWMMFGWKNITLLNITRFKVCIDRGVI